MLILVYEDVLFFLHTVTKNTGNQMKTRQSFNQGLPPSFAHAHILLICPTDVRSRQMLRCTLAMV